MKMYPLSSSFHIHYSLKRWKKAWSFQTFFCVGLVMDWQPIQVVPNSCFVNWKSQRHTWSWLISGKCSKCKQLLQWTILGNWQVKFQYDCTAKKSPRRIQACSTRLKMTQQSVSKWTSCDQLWSSPRDVILACQCGSHCDPNLSYSEGMQNTLLNK